jgi:hypothetical protein
MLIADVARAQTDEIRIPEPATDADNACASLAAYALMNAEANIPLYIRRCGENPNKAACEETARIIKEIASGGSYGLICAGSPQGAEESHVISQTANESTIRAETKAQRAKEDTKERSESLGPRPWDRDAAGKRPWERVDKLPDE